MNKRIFTETALLLVLLAVFLLILPPIIMRHTLELISLNLEKEHELCEEMKENNLIIKKQIFPIALIAITQEGGRIKLGELIVNVKKADNLILESKIELALVNKVNVREKMDIAKKKLKEVSKLHKQTIKDLGVLLKSEPKMIPTRET